MESAWETYVDQYTDRAARDISGEVHASEPLSRLVAYSSSYIFWVTVVCLSTGILLLQ